MVIFHDCGIKFLSRFQSGKIVAQLYFLLYSRKVVKSPKHTFFRGSVSSWPHLVSPSRSKKKHKSKAKKPCIILSLPVFLMVFWGSVITKWETWFQCICIYCICWDASPSQDVSQSPGWQSPLLGLGISKKPYHCYWKMEPLLHRYVYIYICVYSYL